MAENNFLLFSSHIREAGANLTKKERIIADYMLSNPDMILNATAEEIGAATGSSAATVIRFCRTCGFNGLPELKLSLKRENRIMDPKPDRKVDPTLQAKDKASLIKQRVLGYHNMVINTMLSDWNVDAYDMAVDAILKAKRVLLLGEGGSRSSCLNLFYMLLNMGIQCEVYLDSIFEIMKVNSLGPNDVIIAITYTGRVRTTIESLELAKAHGVTTIGLIGYLDSPILQYVDILLNTTSINKDYYDSEISVRISEIIVIEILTSLLSVSEQLPEANRLEDPAISRRRIDRKTFV